MTALSERPIRREISWVRPPILPLTDSRSERVLVAAGSMAYSAVTQPSPEPFRQRGTPSEAEAAHSTFVPPNSTSTEPAAWSSQWRVIVIGRSPSSARPSARGAAVMATTLAATGDTATTTTASETWRRWKHGGAGSGHPRELPDPARRPLPQRDQRAQPHAAQLPPRGGAPRVASPGLPAHRSIGALVGDQSRGAGR